MTDGGCWDDKAAEGKAEVADYRGVSDTCWGQVSADGV